MNLLWGRGGGLKFTVVGEAGTGRGTGREEWEFPEASGGMYEGGMNGKTFATSDEERSCGIQRTDLGGWLGD